MESISRDEALLRLARIEGLVNDLGGMVWEFDWQDAVYTYVSAGAERILGYPASDWLKPGFWRGHVHPEDVGWAAEYCERRTDNLEDHELEYRMTHRTGRVVWVRDIVSIDRENGLEGRLRGILSDITAHRLAVEKLAAKVREFDEVFRITGDLYFHIAPTGEFLDFKAATLDMLYVQPDSFLGKQPSEVLPESLALTVTRNCALACETGVMTMTEYELPVRGESRHWESRFLPLDDGGVVIVSRDITERHEADSALVQSEQRYRTLVGLFPYAIWIASLSDRCLFGNEAARRLLTGDSGLQFVGVRIPDMTPDDASGRSETGRVTAQMRSWTPGTPPPTTSVMRGTMRTIDGRTVHIERAAAGISFEGASAVLIVARDLADELAVEREADEKKNPE